MGLQPFKVGSARSRTRPAYLAGPLMLPGSAEGEGGHAHLRTSVSHTPWAAGRKRARIGIGLDQVGGHPHAYHVHTDTYTQHIRTHRRRYMV